MFSLARLWLLVIAVIVAGMSLGIAPMRADDLPEDTNTIQSLTSEQATGLAVFKGQYLFLRGLDPRPVPEELAHETTARIRGQSH
jgi:hypothetical protein